MCPRTSTVSACVVPASGCPAVIGVNRSDRRWIWSIGGEDPAAEGLRGSRDRRALSFGVTPCAGTGSRWRARSSPSLSGGETQRSRLSTDPALSLVPLARAPQKGCWPTTAPVGEPSIVIDSSTRSAACCLNFELGPDLAAALLRHRERLGVRAFHQPHARLQHGKCFQVERCTARRSLDGEPGLRVCRGGFPEQLQRVRDQAALLHVDLDVHADGLGRVQDPAKRDWRTPTPAAD
jgi:hypothetical protein